MEFLFNGLAVGLVLGVGTGDEDGAPLHLRCPCGVASQHRARTELRRGKSTTKRASTKRASGTRASGRKSGGGGKRSAGRSLQAEMAREFSHPRISPNRTPPVILSAAKDQRSEESRRTEMFGST